jgi:hypothetical protein
MVDFVRVWLVLVLGLLLVIGAVVGFVVVPEHKPALVGGTDLGHGLYTGGFETSWSQTLYDVLRVVTWGLLVVGIVVLVVGLVDYARR